MSKPDFIGGVYVEESPKDFVVAKMRLSVERFDKFLQDPYVQEFLKKNGAIFLTSRRRQKCLSDIFHQVLLFCDVMGKLKFF